MSNPNYPSTIPLHIPRAVFYIVLILGTLLLSMPLPMPTLYLLRCCGEDMRSSKLLRAVFGLWALFFSCAADAWASSPMKAAEPW